jgi:adenylyltransferase/sulfurtransferase
MKTFNVWDFYKRQVALAELGYEGQKKLRSSMVVIIGMGGLGSVTALYLTLSGVGYLRLIDQDTVEIHNLHRQVLYSLNDIRYPKVEAAARRINELNPEVKVEPIAENIREANAESLLKGVDCIVDGLDNMRTRYIINKVSVKHKIPYVFGGAIGLEGNVSVFIPPETPCLNCVFPKINDTTLPTCETRGVLGATVGIIGAIEAMETIKLLAGINNVLKGKLLICDFKGPLLTLVDVFKYLKCPVCQLEIEEKIESEHDLVWLCGSNTVNVNPRKNLQIDLQRAYRILNKYFKILLKSSLVLVFNYNSKIEISLFRHGRMLIKNVNDESEALKIHKDILARIGINSSE